jgi:serine phosphatase RsbU (regulator of sigma subunit)
VDEAFLSGLRDLLQEQCQIPPLPDGWLCTSAMLSAQGFEYGGDFFIADLATTAEGSSSLAMVLVDVCGKGATAVPDAVQFAGALRGLIVTVPSDQLMPAANTFLQRQPSDESIATAVQVVVDLGSGSYAIRSGGHPPVLRWIAEEEEWVVDIARGTALGVVDRPEFPVSEGLLARGDALLFYTDGVVESRRGDIEIGIDWLRAAARNAALAHGLRAVPDRIMEQVSRGDDDRAVLVLARE